MKRILTILLILLALLAGWQAGKQHTIKSLNPFVVDLPDRNVSGGFDEDDFPLYIEIDGTIFNYSAWIG